MSLALRPSRRSLLALAGLGAGASVLAACADSGGSGGSGSAPTVVTSCYPLDFVTGRIAGERVELISLASPGADAHGVELSVKQVMQIQEAALVLQIAGFQTSLDDAVSSSDGENVLEISTVVEMLPTGGHADHDHDHEASDAGGEESHEDHDHGENDPHFWLDPLRLADVGDAVAERLGRIDPDGAEDFTANAGTLRTELEELDAELSADFGAISGERTFITSHAAYAYLADRNDLHQVGITGVDPEAEPSPQRLLALEEVVAEEDVSTIFFETTASPKVARTLAENVGVDSEELDNLATQLSPEADYPQVMRDNCRALRESWT